MRSFILVLLLMIVKSGVAQIYVGKETLVQFNSASIIEDISATNKSSVPVFNLATRELVFKIPVSAFTFQSRLMQDHFNENFLETEKYPYALFQGTINPAVDYAVPGTYHVTASGTITVHGVQKEISTPATMVVEPESVSFLSEFKLKIADYNIRVPSLYIKNIAEFVDVRINAQLAPYKKSIVQK